MNNRCPVCNRTFPFPEAILQHIKDKKDDKHKYYRQNNISSAYQLMPEKRRFWVFRLSLGGYDGEPSRICDLDINRPRLKQEIIRYKENFYPIDRSVYPQLNMNILKNELFERGKLRQGWGSEFEGMNLDLNLPKEKWFENYMKLDWRIWDYESDCPIAQGRYDILKLMKDMKEGHIIFIPRIPDDNHFTVVRVNKEGYHFQKLNSYLGHGHVIEVDKNKINVFEYGKGDIERIAFMHYRKALDEIRSHHLIYPKIIKFIQNHYL